MGRSVARGKKMIVLRQPSPVQVMIGQEQLEHNDYLNYLASLTKCVEKIYARKRIRTAKAKVAFNKKVAPFNRKLDNFACLWTQYGVWESDLVYV